MTDKKKKDVILWKVVNNETRQSIIVGRSDTRQEVTDKLVLTYKKGTIVRAKRGSFGCFCFDDKCHANRYALEEPNSLVIRVKAIGTKKPTTQHIPRLRSAYLEEILSVIKSIKTGIYSFTPTWSVPSHTVCYTAVEVLD